MTTSSYWSEILSNRVSRRRALASSGLAVASAALVAACGGGSQKTQPQVASLISTITDTSKQAKRGGTFKTSRTVDPPTWDPHVTSSQWNTTISAIFGRLTILKPGYLDDSAGEVVGNHAESWEFSPDKQTLTFKLRPNMTWHQIAPVNGRTVDVDDVLFSSKRLAAQGTNRAAFFNSINPAAPIQSVTAPDARTIVFKLAFPMVTLPALLGFEFGGNFMILPREADGGFDIRHQPIGSGPWYLQEHTPSLRFIMKRHPGYFDKERPYADGVDWAVIPEYATGLAQFKAGSLHEFAVTADDVLATKGDVPQLALYQSSVAVNGNAIFFGWRPTAKSPFRDIRMRQALSMTLDRDLFIEANYNVSKLQAAGVPVETRWNSHLPANYFSGWWLDPKGKDFGENAKYFQHDVQTAKQLIAAAGYPNGIEITATSAPDNYGAQYAKDIQVIHGFASDAGLRYVDNVIGYNTGYQPQYRDSRGDFDGETYRNVIGGDTDAIEALAAIYSTSAGATFVGLDPNGKGDFSGDPYIEDQILKGRTETDIEKRRAIVKDVQRYLGKQQYIVRYPGGASGLDIVWPAIKNRRVYRGPTASFIGPHYYQWLDDSLPPFKST